MLSIRRFDMRYDVRVATELTGAHRLGKWNGGIWSRVPTVASTIYRLLQQLPYTHTFIYRTQLDCEAKVLELTPCPNTTWNHDPYLV